MPPVPHALRPVDAMRGDRPGPDRFPSLGLRSCGPYSGMVACAASSHSTVRSLRVLLLILAFLAVALAAFAQPASCTLVLSGRVIDEHDGESLAFAEVFIASLGKGAVANELGDFRMEGLCPGIYQVRVSHLGCDPVTREVRLTASATIDFKLEHHAEELRELEVIQARPDEQVGQPAKSVDREDMGRAAGAGIAELLARVPGVTVLATGPSIGKPVIHGLSGNRVLILNQGIRQEDQQWGSEHAPSLDPLSADRLTVVKGAASVQYGSDAIGGVVIVEPVELPRAAGISGELRGLGQWNGRGGGGSGLLEGGVKGITGLGWRVQGSGRYLGDSEAARYTLSNTGQHEWGGSASVGYRDHRRGASVHYSRFTRELGILRAAHIGSTTDLQRAIESGEPWYTAPFSYAIDAPRQAVTHHLLRAQGSIALTDRSRVEFNYGYQANDRQEYDIRRAGRSATPALDLWLATHTAEAVLKHWVGKHVHGKVGVTALTQENTNIPGTGVRPLIPDFRKESIGAFIIEHCPVRERLELEAGARVEGTTLNVRRFDRDGQLRTLEHQFTNAAFALGVSQQLGDSARLRLGLASAFRPPHVSELHSEGLHQSAVAIEEGDASLGSERSLKATLDAEAALFGGRLRIDATVHASRIEGFIYLRPDGTRLTIRGAFPVFRYTATDALMGGLDASASLRLSKRFVWRMGGSTVLARDQRNDEWLFLMPADRLENGLRLRTASVGKWRAFEAGATHQVVSEQRRVPVGLDFAPPPSTYHLFALSASASRTLGKGELRIGLQANNLFNTAYRDYLDRFRYFTDARGTDIVLSVRYTFGRFAEKRLHDAG
jgi:iron complex outermembrane receptor protein